MNKNTYITSSLKIKSLLQNKSFWAFLYNDLTFLPSFLFLLSDNFYYSLIYLLIYSITDQSAFTMLVPDFFSVFLFFHIISRQLHFLPKIFLVPEFSFKYHINPPKILFMNIPALLKSFSFIKIKSKFLCLAFEVLKSLSHFHTNPLFTRLFLNYFHSYIKIILSHLLLVL